MVYWVGYNKSGRGEVIRVRGYDSIVKTRVKAAEFMKLNNFDSVAIFRSKTAKYHIEVLSAWTYGSILVEKYNPKIKRFESYIMSAKGTLRQF